MYTTDCNYFRITNYNNVQVGYYRITGCTDIVSVNSVDPIQTTYICGKNILVEQYGAPLDVTFIGLCPSNTPTPTITPTVTILPPLSIIYTLTDPGGQNLKGVIVK